MYKFTYYLCLLSLALSAVVRAQPEPGHGSGSLVSKLQIMESRVFVDPLAAWQELAAAEAEYDEADPVARLWILLRRAQAHDALFMQEEFAEDIALARTLREANNIDVSPDTIVLLLWLDYYAALVDVRDGKLQSAVDTLENVASRAQANDAARAYVFAVQELAYIRGVLEQYDKSLTDIHRAYRVALELDEPDLLATVDDAYAAIYGYMGDYPRSIEHYQKALSAFRQLGYKKQTSSVLLGLASTFRYAGQRQEAERYYREYLEFTRYAPGTDQLYFGTYGVAMTIAEMGSCEKALPEIVIALQYEGPEDYDAELYKQMALCKAQSGDIDGAGESLARATAILNNMPELAGTSWVLELDRVASVIELNRGNAPLAYELLERYSDETVERLEASSSHRMDMLRADLEADRKDLQIALLERQAEINKLQVEAQLQANKNQRYMILLSVMISLAVLAGLLIQRRNNRRILALSHRDGLSGLYNRSYTFDYLDEVIPNISVADGGLSIILLDIDNFKDINDSYGHPVGDEVIRKIAAIGERSLRNRDIMGRIGGEEFLCVLPRTTAEQSMQVAERLLRAIADERFITPEGQRFSTSISIGIADFEQGVENADQLYARADQALYQSKADGKGRITVFNAAPLQAAQASE